MRKPGGSRGPYAGKRAGPGPHAGERAGRGALRGGGFTLIELMVVIAIIAILISITIPVYRGAREHVRQRACMANLYQIANALRIYRVDEGAYPGPYDPVTGEGGLNQLYPYYLDNRRALVCPDDPIREGLNYAEQYATLLAAADAAGMYSEPVWENRWADKGFFSEHYSSYNALYNYMGYVLVPKKYSLWGDIDYEMNVGDSIAYWYEYFRWDPENKLDYTTYPSRFNEVDAFLHYHLAQQVYWGNYLNAPRRTEDATRLVDNLGRPLWDMGDVPSNPGVEGYYPYGMYSSVFPGMINRNAPDNTIVTRCPCHRDWTVVRVREESAQQPGDREGARGSQRYSTQLRQKDTPRDIVLRLDGSCSLVRGFGYDWARQPR